MGSEPCEERVFITHPRPAPAPAPRRSRIAFSARISKAAPGLFRSRNLILLWVYFSTLENSQCRTRSRPHPACGRPPCSPGGGRVGPGDRVLPCRPSAGHSPHEWLGAGPGTRGAGWGAPIHAHSSDCPAAWPWDPAGPLRLPWGNNCGWKGEGVSRSDWSSDRRLRRGSPAPGTESTEGPRPEGPGPGEPGRDQQPLTAPLAALADLNWPRESSPQDPPPSHPRAQTETCTLTHTHTYIHSRSCSPAHTTTHISTHAHGHKLALTHVLTCTLTDTHLHTQT